MATAVAFYGVDITKVDFNYYSRNYDDSFFSNNTNQTVLGHAYEDNLVVKAGSQNLTFGGSGITLNKAGDVIGGTVQAFTEGLWGGPVAWGAYGASIAAQTVYNAVMTASTTDDFAVLATVFGGNDTFTLSDEDDVMRGFGGNDKMTGNGGNDTLMGEAGRDTLNGGKGNDTLDGGDGNDKLIGGAGKDTLTGGDGADYFIFKSERDSGVGTKSDTIVGYTGADFIDLSAIDAKATPDGDQGFTFIGNGSFVVGLEGEGLLRYAGGILSGDTDGDGTANFAIKLAGSPALAGDHIIL